MAAVVASFRGRHNAQAVAWQQQSSGLRHNSAQVAYTVQAARRGMNSPPAPTPPPQQKNTGERIMQAGRRMATQPEKEPATQRRTECHQK